MRVSTVARINKLITVIATKSVFGLQHINLEDLFGASRCVARQLRASCKEGHCRPQPTQGKQQLHLQSSSSQRLR